MKYLKMLGLAAVAAAALMAFVGASSASAATLLCRVSENPCAAGNTYGAGTKIHAVSEGEVILKATFAEVKCESTVEGEVTEAPNKAGTTVGIITTLNFTNCTSPCTSATALKNAAGNFGTLEIHTEGTTSNGNGTMTGFNAEVTIVCSGVPCTFGTEPTTGTDLGELTGGPEATMDIHATVKYRGDSTNFICTGGTGNGTWSGSYKVTSPTPLFVI